MCELVLTIANATEGSEPPPLATPSPPGCGAPNGGNIGNAGGASATKVATAIGGAFSITKFTICSNGSSSVSATSSTTTTSSSTIRSSSPY